MTSKTTKRWADDEDDEVILVRKPKEQKDSSSGGKAQNLPVNSTKEVKEMTKVGKALELLSNKFKNVAAMGGKKKKKYPKRLVMQPSEAKMLCEMPKQSLSGLLGNAHYLIRLAVTGALAADGSGNLFVSLSLNPSTYQEWAECAELFDEFRILHGAFHFGPTNKYNRASTDVVRAAVATFDNDSSTALASYNEAVEYANMKLHNMSDQFVYAWRRPNITASAYWCDTASPATSLGGFLLTGAGFTNSIALGIYVHEIFIEFRGKT